ncbi:MAG: hypothetical protein JW957_08120 [Candidatus Omnitrophica bacterium]|nr:hypothetical protein [Candidatus Omnitrophota bacterium]
MKKIVAAAAILFWTASAFCQTASRVPSVGYAYPGGGQQGSVVQVTVGGQNLRGVVGAHISGEGVSAVEVKYIPILNALQRQELQKRLKAIREKRMRAAKAGRINPAAKQEEKKDKAGQEKTEESGKPAEEQKPVELPEHPLLLNLENLTPYQLKQVVDIFIPFQRLQVSRSIQEMALLEIHIEEDAPPGKRELRLKTSGGLTNPLFFEVGTAPEICETEPNGPYNAPAEVSELPAVLNGQIMPGDADRFRFKAKQGQNLVIEARAKRIMPYLADAVPGWFQAVMILYDENGNEAVYADDYRFSPDPVIFYNVARDGEYTLEIRDSIYRGREDFVYRVSIGENPFVAGIFPLGGRSGEKTVVSAEGWNLSEKSLVLDTSPEGTFIRETSLKEGDVFSNSICYAVDNIPESFENEPNGSQRTAQHVSIPVTVNGRISEPGDADVFAVKCRAGYEFSAEVYARRLGSPMDSLLVLADSSGRILTSSDDSEDRASGLNTHHADSILSFRVPADGTYFLRIAETQGHGGGEYAYRLRMGPAYPDFELRATPSAVNLNAGGSQAVKIHALRKRGFSENIELALAGETHGFTIQGGFIPAGRDSVYITLTAPLQTEDSPFALTIEGRSVINGQEAVRPVIAAEEMMQAFAYFHLVPSGSLTASVLRPRFRGLSMKPETSGTLRISPGGEAEISVSVRSLMNLATLIPQMKEPAEGISIAKVKSGPEKLSFVLKADAEKVKKGFRDNVIVEVFSNIPVGKPDEKGVRKKQKISLGIIPAIPLEIIE